MFATHTALLVFLEKLVASNTNEMKAQRQFSVMFIQEMSAAADGRPVDHTVSQLQSHQVLARSAQLSGQTWRAGYVDQLITVLRLSRSILPAAVNTYTNKPFDDSICLCLEDNDAGLTCICSFRVSRQVGKSIKHFHDSNI